VRYYIMVKIHPKKRITFQYNGEEKDREISPKENCSNSTPLIAVGSTLEKESGTNKRGESFLQRFRKKFSEGETTAKKTCQGEKKKRE